MARVLLVGEIFVDYTITSRGEENKLRLGGIVHAARGLWAAKCEYSVAAVLPTYLVDLAKRYLHAFGCQDFFILGDVKGAPNVTVIMDAQEVADQGYDTLLRDEKSVQVDLTALAGNFHDVLLFPGSYDAVEVCRAVDPDANLHLDIAYDLADASRMGAIGRPVSSVLISTSSPLFAALEDQSIEGLAREVASCSPSHIVLKHNRGGSELLQTASGHVTKLPAQLGRTVNSVGVGDVFAATFVASLSHGEVEAAWRASYAASAYSQTTYPDQFAKYVERDARLDVHSMEGIGGSFLPWNVRPEFQIYFAAPDFDYVDRAAIEKSLAALSYHGFRVRRPVLEFGQLPLETSLPQLAAIFRQDYNLLRSCRLIFAVPTDKDPGTLVEIGIGIEAGIPVIVYDPDGVAANTMVIAGSICYSNDLDTCLNATFLVMSGLLANG